MSNQTSITKDQIRSQAIWYFLVLVLWPLYLLLLPPFFAFYGGWAILYVIFPGLYVSTWVGYLMHESWHQYVPNVNNRLFYNLFAIMILSDPQLYHIIHGSHHAQVHTYEDAEFHPLGEIKSKGLRMIYNWLEVVFGVSFLLSVASLTIPRDPRFARKYRFWKLPVSILAWVICFGGIGYLSHVLFGVTFVQVALSFAVNLWVGSFFLHQSQLVEHGNLIVQGTVKERNVCTRNLKPVGIAEKTFLFLTHNDSREHVLHHTLTPILSRPFPGMIPLPEKAVMITMRDYVGILRQMLRGRS